MGFLFTLSCLLFLAFRSAQTARLVTRASKLIKTHSAQFKPRQTSREPDKLSSGDPPAQLPRPARQPARPTLGCHAPSTARAPRRVARALGLPSTRLGRGRLTSWGRPPPREPSLRPPARRALPAAPNSAGGSAASSPRSHRRVRRLPDWRRVEKGKEARRQRPGAGASGAARVQTPGAPPA